MIEVFQAVVDALPKLLKDKEGWDSLKVDYGHPYVDRLWRQFDDGNRVLLHKIYPCDAGQSLVHPHPWPSMIRIMGGTWCGEYELGIGWGDPTGESPPIAAKITMSRGGLYEMTDPRAWHYVRPIDSPVFSLMVVGKPFSTPKQERFGQLRQHNRLSGDERERIFGFWRGYFPG